MDIFEQKYKGIDPKIAEQLEAYEYEYFREDKPVPFCGLFVYPAKVRDYELFSNCVSCLSLNKNEDPQGIRMSQQEYLIYKMRMDDKEGYSWSYRLQKLFEIIFHINNGLKCAHCGHVISYDSQLFKDFVTKISSIENIAELKEEDIPQLVCPECQEKEFVEMIKITTDDKTGKACFLVDGKKIGKKDFDLLRALVLFQNYPDYRDESWVDPALRKDHEEKLRLEQQNNDVYASIEKKVVCLSISTHYKFDEIYDMSIRKFTMALSAVDDLINYKIMRTAVSSGFVSLPDGKKIEHWIYKPIKDMYGEYKSMDEATAEANNL